MQCKTASFFARNGPLGNAKRPVSPPRLGAKVKKDEKHQLSEWPTAAIRDSILKFAQRLKQPATQTKRLRQMANIIKAMVCPCILLCATATAFAQDVKVHLDEAGTLESKIERSRYDQIKKLTVSGYVNGADLYDIRDMDNLEVLDLSEATIVASGSFGTSTYTEGNSICSGNFSNCEVRTLILPNSLLYINYQAFYGAYNLEKIVIGDRLQSFSFEAFVNPQNSYGHSFTTCKQMREFEVSEHNPNFAAADGVLFDKAMTTLLFYPNKKAKQYAVPEGVERINGKAFSCCDNLYEITLPKSLTYIGGSAFEGCEMLLGITSLNPTPPEAQESLNGGVFYGVPDETCVLYVPEGSYSAYWMAPGWGVFDNIVEIDPTAIEAAPCTETTVRCIEGGMEITTAEAGAQVQVYTAGGTLAYSGKGGRVMLPAGAYIVKAGGSAQKVLVE